MSKCVCGRPHAESACVAAMQGRGDGWLEGFRLGKQMTDETWRMSLHEYFNRQRDDESAA